MSSLLCRSWIGLLLLVVATVSLAYGDVLPDDGIQAYRDGEYQKAEQMLQQAHTQHPEDSKITYYLAMSQAQLGRFKQAKALYQEIITLDPQSEAAQLAKEGLSYLPEDDSLDRPPRFQAKQKSKPDEEPDKTGAVQPQAQSNGMSMQDMLMWQALLGQMGGNNQQQGGMNATGLLPWMLMPQGDGKNTPSIDPSVMSNLLMNQMMQNFSLGGSSENNR